MTISLDDWRLQGQEKYLKGVSLSYKKYVPYREGWEHDHCEFCGRKFMQNDPEALEAGYVTDDNYHWVCKDCYGDFKKLFEWVP